MNKKNAYVGGRDRERGKNTYRRSTLRRRMGGRENAHL